MDHRALLSILKERSSKIHQSRLTRWCDRLIPFTFTIEHIPGSKIGMADYMSRNPDQIGTPPSTYDADFIIAQIIVIKNTLNIIRKRGRPKKEAIEKAEHTTKIKRRRGRPRKQDINTQHAQHTPQQNTPNPTHENNNQPTIRVESRHEYDKSKKSVESLHDSNQENCRLKLPHDSTTINTKDQKWCHNNDHMLQNEQPCETSRTKNNYNNNYNLRSNRKNATEHIPNTEYDVIKNKIVLNHTIKKAHLPISLSPAQQHSQTLHLSESNKMSKSTETQNPQASPSRPKFSMSNLLSPSKSPSAETQQHPKDKEVNDMIQGVFNMKLIAVMTNRDSVLREVRDCILTNDEQRCKKLCKQIHGQWRNLSTHNGCILVDNKLAIPHVMKEPVMDILHATHPGAWGMTELGQRLWWPYINRDLINKSKTCRPCTEFGKNLKNLIPKTKWAPLPRCSEPNEEIQIDFGGPIIDGHGREIYFLACIDRFSKFPTLKLYNNDNGPNIEKFLNKYIVQHGVPRNLRIDQARCLKGNKVQQVCDKHNINIIFAPAGDHRAIGLVERLVQTVKRRLGCIKLDPKQKPFNIKQALSQITYELRICRKSTKVSPFEAHHGRKPNTALSNATTNAHKSNLDWSNTINAYLDDNIIVQEDLISDERWEQSDLDSDSEVKAAKAKKLKEAREDIGDVPRIIKMESSKFEEPLAKTSPRLLLARKNLATTRSKKNLQGLYEAVPEGTVLVKTTDATLTLKMPGQKDTVLNKSDVAKFGTPEQRNIPLINFAARKTVRNHHKKFEELMQSHGKAQMNKIMGIRSIRKRDTQPREPHARSNLEKVSRTKVPPKRRYTQTHYRTPQLKSENTKHTIWHRPQRQRGLAIRERIPANEKVLWNNELPSTPGPTSTSTNFHSPS